VSIEVKEGVGLSVVLAWACGADVRRWGERVWLVSHVRDRWATLGVDDPQRQTTLRPRDCVRGPVERARQQFGPARHSRSPPCIPMISEE
jgi:hypothetical protein